MNPLLPLDQFVPDGEARQHADGRLYLYGSLDVPGDDSYCSCRYRVLSSDSLTHWTDHGVSFSTSDGAAGEFEGNRLYAPDCVCKDGVYYLYFCLSNGREAVATSGSPAGPFSDPVAVIGADGDGIDPSVFIDDDGQAYYYWGQFSLCGARLKENMRELDMSTVNRALITEQEHGFHEGASVRKHNGIYYLLYTDISRGGASCISYAMSRSPLGPFTKGGVVIDNTGCDPKNWNDHGCIAEFNGSWYVFYHRATNNSCFSRRACAEPITFTADGRIPEVEMTTQGTQGPLSPLPVLEAGRACLLSGAAYIESRLEQGVYQEYISHIQDGNWAAYKYFDFGQAAVSGFTMAAANGRFDSVYSARVELRLDSPDGTLIGTLDIPPTGGWTDWRDFSCPVQPVQGRHALYLVFHGDLGRLCSVKEFHFIA